MGKYVFGLIAVLLLTGCATPSMKRTIAGRLREVMQAADCDTACAKTCIMLRTRLNEEIRELDGK